MPKKWLKEKCIFCSLCIPLCPQGAFQLKKRSIDYFPSKCLDCEECLPNIGCPRRAIK